MAQQGTEQTSSDQPSSEEASGRHRASGEDGSEQQSAPAESTDSASGEGSQESSSESSSESASAEGSSEKQQSAAAEGTSEKQESSPSEAPTEKQQSAPSEAPTQKQESAPSEAPTQKQQRGAADTSWAEPETSSRRHVDVGEIVWRAGNVLATVLRTLALLFALVLIVNVVLVLVGVNPANGVAQFIGGLADAVILGFRNLFVPADPTVALIVNSLVAAVFWVFVGELVSRLIRFLAARVK